MPSSPHNPYWDALVCWIHEGRVPEGTLTESASKEPSLARLLVEATGRRFPPPLDSLREVAERDQEC